LAHHARDADGRSAAARAARQSDAVDSVARERIFSEIAMVENFARMGRRPQWNVGTPSPQRIIGKNNRPVLVGESKGDGRYSAGSHCPLNYTAPTIEQLIVRRFEYVVWHDGLTRLAGTLRAWLLRDHVAGKLNARPTPWLDPAPASEIVVPIDGVAVAWPHAEQGLAEMAALREAEAAADDEAVAEAEREKRRGKRNVPII
jgi:hypothetical protein